MAEITTWNNYIKVAAQTQQLSGALNLLPKEGAIAFGSGLSYGDAPLGEQIILTNSWTGILAYDKLAGTITCKSGTTLREILNTVFQDRWFFNVTPGTKNITVGGAVAADVHGKNHCSNGSFCDHVLSMVVQTNENTGTFCSPTENDELFRHTCGGMGLTGIITEVTLQLKRTEYKMINVVNRKVSDPDELMTLFETSNAEYKIAWISQGATRHFRSIFTEGNPAKQTTEIVPANREPKRIPTPFPLVNRFTIRLHDTFRYANTKTHKLVHLLNFMYPLDGITNWNQAYGKNGFIQYQCVIPMHGKSFLKQIMNLAFTKQTPFLSVLKQLGKSRRDSPLSFPIEGFTLAMDFRITEGLLPLLEQLDQLVVQSGGRVYLAKDCRLSAVNFKLMYPQWKHFQEFIQKNNNRKFHSRLSDRLQITNA